MRTSAHKSQTHVLKVQHSSFVILETSQYPQNPLIQCYQHFVFTKFYSPISGFAISMIHMFTRSSRTPYHQCPILCSQGPLCTIIPGSHVLSILYPEGPIFLVFYGLCNCSPKFQESCVFNGLYFQRSVFTNS